MAKVAVSKAVIEQFVFGFHPNAVEVRGAKFDEAAGTIVFDVDVPNFGGDQWLHGVFTEERNAAGDRLRRLNFEPIAAPTSLDGA